MTGAKVVNSRKLIRIFMMTELHSITLVVASQRSGSTLLCSDIASLGGMGKPNEYFLNILPPKKTFNESDVIEAIAKGEQPCDVGIGAVKLMVNYARNIDKYISGGPVVKEKNAIQNIIDWACTRFEKVNLLALVRNNTLDQATSRIISREKGLYHSHQGSHGNEDLLMFIKSKNPDYYWNILSEILIIKRESEVIREIADANRDICLLLEYEMLTTSFDQSSALLIDHAHMLGFVTKKQIPTRNLRKIIEKNQSDNIKEDFRIFMNSQLNAWVGN
jgi:LPS sulfotransferase NodH